jgi:hypothetical protein
MNKTVKSTIDTIGSVVGVISENLQNYTTKALNEIKNMNPETESEIKPVLGYKTGNQGWYDTIGGGPCNTYCRYTGISPEVKWTCSPETDLAHLIPTPQKKSGRYCYDYDGKTTPSEKNGVVVRGTYVPTKAPKKAEGAGDYNFILSRNKDAKGIELFDNGLDNDDNGLEHFESTGSYSSYVSAAPGTDSPGNDIIDFDGHLAQCADRCYNTQGCNGFVTDSYDTHCWLKSGIYWPNVNPNWDRNIWTMNRNPPSSDGRYVGPERDHTITTVAGVANIIGGSTTARNPIECGQDCIANLNCTGFVTDNLGTQCGLLNDNSDISYRPGSGYNFYKMNGHFVVEDALSLSDCENVCENDDTCKAFSYSNATGACAISQEKLTPVGLNTNNIVGTKKEHLALTGTYNIYQNNACINSSIFGSNPTVESSLGLKVDSNGVPIMPTQPVCSSQMNNDFIFGKNFEIMTMQQDKGSSDISTNNNTYWGDSNIVFANQQTDDNKSWDLTDAYCLQKNSDNTVSTDTCTYAPNQRWTYDETLNNIRSWDGNCLNIDTANNNLIVSVKQCANDINQQFNLKPVAEKLQPKFNVISTTNTVDDIITSGSRVAGSGSTSDIKTASSSNYMFGNRDYSQYRVVENFDNTNNTNNQINQLENFSATNTNINNYLSSNRNNADYLYKLPYGNPYIKNINNIKENYQSVEEEYTSSNSLYFIYLIVLVILLVLIMKK